MLNVEVINRIDVCAPTYSGYILFAVTTYR